MKKYFKYQLKESLIPVIIATVIGIVIYSTIISVQGLKPSIGHDPRSYFYLQSLNLGFYGFLIIILAIIIPIRQLNYLKDKRLNDLYFSFPVNRTKLLFVNLLIGFLQIITIFTIVYWVGFLVAVINFAPYINDVKHFQTFYNPLAKGYRFILYIPLYFLIILFSLIPYLCFSFIYSKANNKLDGIILYIMYLVSSMLIFYLLTITFSYNIASVQFFTPYGPLMSIINLYINAIEGRRMPIVTFSFEYINFSQPLFVYFFATIIATSLLFSHEKDRKNEDINQITNSKFGYVVLIPVTSILLLASIVARVYILYTLVYIAFIVVGIIIVQMIYQKTIKMHFKYYIYVLIYLVVGIGIGLIINASL